MGGVAFFHVPGRPKMRPEKGAKMSSKMALKTAPKRVLERFFWSIFGLFSGGPQGHFDW